MSLVPTPARTSGDLGAALSNVRSPNVNELSAVHIESIKDHLIEHAAALNALSVPVRGFPVGTTDTLVSDDLARFVIYIVVTATITLPDLSSGWTGIGRMRLFSIGSTLSFTTASGATLNGSSATAKPTVDGGIRDLTLYTGNGKDWYLDTEAFPGPVTIAGASHTLTDFDNGKTLFVDHAGECTITVPQTLTPGFSCSVQNVDAAATTTWVASGTQTLLGPAGYTKNTARYATSGVIVRSATAAALMGALDS